jgi:hypothetical protein
VLVLTFMLVGNVLLQRHSHLVGLLLSLLGRVTVQFELSDGFL